MGADDFDSLLNLLPEPAAAVSADGIIRAANPAFARLVGIAAPGTNLLDRVADEPDAVRRYLRRCASVRQFLPGALTVRTVDGAAVACRSDAGVLRPGTAEQPTVVLLRLMRHESAVQHFIALNRRIGDLSAEVGRRRRAEERAAQALADQSALRDRLSKLVDASGTLVAALAIDDVFSAVGTLAAELLPADAYAVWRRDDADARWNIVWHRGLSEAFLAASSAWTSAYGAVPFREPIAIRNIEDVPLLDPRRAVYGAEGIESILILPLRIRDEVHGTIVAYCRAKTAFSDADMSIAQALGNLASSAITTASLYDEQIRHRRTAELAERRAQFLASVGAVLAESLDYQRTLQAVADLAVPAIADWCIVDAADPGGELKRIAIAHAHPEKRELARQFEQRYPEDRESAYGRYAVMRTGRPVLIEHISDEMLASRVTDPERLALLRQIGIRSVISVPLLAKAKPIGVLTFIASSLDARYTAADVRFVEEVASRAAMAIENARAYEEARRANQLKDDFLATLSHELRTPLNAILGYLRMLRDGVIATDRQARALEVVERNSTSLAQMVEDVLDVSRIVAGKIRLDMRRVDLAHVLPLAVATVMPTAEARGVRLDVSLGPDIGLVAGDPERLQQIIWNLLANAVKFTPRGGVVEVGVRRAGPDVEIEVTDTGIGIAPEFLPYVFEPFRQADSRFAREHGGLGLGLAITRRLVELHGGAIRATSAGPGAGATFVVSLPAAAIHDVGRLPAIEDAAPPAPTTLL